MQRDYKNELYENQADGNGPRIKSNEEDDDGELLYNEVYHGKSRRVNT